MEDEKIVAVGLELFGRTDDAAEGQDSGEAERVTGGERERD